MDNKEISLTGKLLKIKEWLTIPETAEHLSILFGEEVTEADVYRLALNGHLKISIYFIGQAIGKPKKELSDIDHIEEWLSEAPRNSWSEEKKDRYRRLANPRVQSIIDDASRKTKILFGIWDLWIIGNAKRYVENKFFNLTCNQSVKSVSIIGFLVQGKDGELYEILDKTSRDWRSRRTVKKNGEKISEEYEDDLPTPFAEAPEYTIPENQLVVRTQALLEFQDNFSLEKSSSKEEITIQSKLLFDSESPFNGNELKIAVEAWTELYEKNPPSRTPSGGHKKYIGKWLDKNYPSLSDRAKERLKSVVNPNQKGGASPIG